FVDRRCRHSVCTGAVGLGGAELARYPVRNFNRSGVDGWAVDRRARLSLCRCFRAAPFSYTQLLWVSILGFLIFGEVPDVWTVTGAVFIVASGLYTAHRERLRPSQPLLVEGELSPNP